MVNYQFQKIYYGVSGCGKSKKVKTDTEGMVVFRTVFHPNSDYNSFVGTCKSSFFIDDQGKINCVQSFVPQIFTKAYTQAWNDPSKPVCLVIEDINMGNCIQILGELSQVFDRDTNGFSEYETDANAELGSYLIEFFTMNIVAADRLSEQLVKKGCLDNAYSKIILPDNLYIYATMNTSDEPMFLMDNAFKRKWAWENVPIDYYTANIFTIELGHLSYPWGVFLENVNKRIVELTGSENKQLGQYFVNPQDGVISLETFKSKVIYYLWSELYANGKNKTKNMFVYKPDLTSIITEPFMFSDLYVTDCNGISRDLDILPSFMELLNVHHLPIACYHG